MLRFTIRDLLWLTVVVALGVAWWLDRSRLASEVHRLCDFHKSHFEIQPGVWAEL